MRSAVLKWMMACVVAIGMIAQAAALVRHDGAMLAKSFGSVVTTDTGSSGNAAVAALEADLKTAICHPSGTDSGEPVVSRNSGSEPGSSTDCPICSGLVSAYGLAAHNVTSFPLSVGCIDRALPHIDQVVLRARLVWPPSRGPPAYA